MISDGFFCFFDVGFTNPDPARGRPRGRFCCTDDDKDDDDEEDEEEEDEEEDEG